MESIVRRLSREWAINGKKLTISYTTNIITADISDDGKLMNIEDNYNSYVINNGEQLTNPNISLDTIVWKATAIDGFKFQMIFKQGFKVDTNPPNIIFPYIRSGSGRVIRIDTGGGIHVFGVIINSFEMKGSNSVFSLWEATKQ